ncbi:MAG: hypothetical protein ACLFVU_07950 [Phycisphaerae bacterium]
MLKRTLTIVAVLGLAVTLGQGAKKNKPKLQDGQTFHVTESYPRYVTVDMEFRDVADKKWPSFTYGRPVGKGTFTYTNNGPKGSFTLACDRICQPQGDQSRRVLGEIVRDAEIKPITFEVKSFGPAKERTVTEKKGKGTRKRTYNYAPAKGVLTIDGKATPIEAECTWEYPATVAKCMQITFRLEIDGKKLGLEAPGSTGPLSIRITTSAFDTIPEGKKRRR